MGVGCLCGCGCVGICVGVSVWVWVWMFLYGRWVPVWVWVCGYLCGGVRVCVGVWVWGVGVFECACVYTDCKVYPPTACRPVVSHYTGGCLSLTHAAESHR